MKKICNSFFFLSLSLSLSLKKKKKKKKNAKTFFHKKKETAVLKLIPALAQARTFPSSISER